MKIFTRIAFFINKATLYLQRKNSFFKEVFSFALFTLFFGFLIGNLFGTFLNTIRSFILWDGFIIFIILFIMEFYNCFLYNRFFKKIRGFRPLLFFSQEKNNIEFVPFFYKQNIFSNNQMIWKIINLLKIGIFFGFFIEAFKVGS